MAEELRLEKREVTGGSRAEALGLMERVMLQEIGMKTVSVSVREEAKKCTITICFRSSK